MKSFKYLILIKFHLASQISSFCHNMNLIKSGNKFFLLDYNIFYFDTVNCMIYIKHKRYRLFFIKRTHPKYTKY